tara:strand:- start:1048 stop:1917 length:870 start_codon:yes stop_codon:yes gene_type:complete
MREQKSMNNNLMILAAGMSSRMKKSAEVNKKSKVSEQALLKPKMMLGVGSNGRPFLDYLIFNAKKAGYNDILFIVNDKDNTVKNYYSEKKSLPEYEGLKFSFATQKIAPGRTKPLGTADAVLSGLEIRSDWKGQKFCVCNSDNLYSVNSLKLLLDDNHPASLIDYDRDALGVEPERVKSFAVIWKDQSSYLADIVEKPNEEQVLKATDINQRIGVSMNIFSLDYDIIIPYLKNTPINSLRDEKELTETIRMLVSDLKNSVFTIPLSEPVPDLTTVNDMDDVESFMGLTQ